MTATFTVETEGHIIRCKIGTDVPLVRPVFCFSLMAPAHVLRGGTLGRSLGGYAEVIFDDLAAGQTATIEVAYAGDFTPRNRAWLPMGAFVRHAGGLMPLPALPAGVARSPAPPAAAANGGLCLCPPPANWQPDGGQINLMPGFAAKHEAFAVVDDLRLASRLGAASFLTGGGIPVQIMTDETLAAEAYRLEIGGAAVRLWAKDRAGVFYGAITLRTLQITHGDQAPTGVIEDRPRFGWRGQHLDCARNFRSVDTIRQLMDLMAMFKLNRFHWHFADDEAFRLQIDSYPALWQKTAYRGEGELLPGLFGGGIRAGGSYSKAEVADLIAYAKARNIEILPEIEVPAHALAMNAAIAGLRDPADNGAETSVQGYAANTINPAMPRMWEVTNAIAAEVAQLFPFGILHLGCDELPHDTWAGSPAVAALKAREGLETTDDVQGWTMERIAAGVTALGVRPAAWEEAARGANGGIGHDAILFSWSGQGPGIAAARRGYDVVMSPAQHIYLDMAHTDDPQDWGATWAAITPLENTVDWRVVPEEAQDIAERIIGIEGTFWSEFSTDDAEIWPMLMPRMMGVAAKAWEPDERLDGKGLRRLADVYRATLIGNWHWHYGA